MGVGCFSVPVEPSESHGNVPIIIFYVGVQIDPHPTQSPSETGRQGLWEKVLVKFTP
jgi:hypothetical protein